MLEIVSTTLAFSSHIFRLKAGSEKHQESVSKIPIFVVSHKKNYKTPQRNGSQVLRHINNF